MFAYIKKKKHTLLQVDSQFPYLFIYLFLYAYYLPIWRKREVIIIAGKDHTNCFVVQSNVKGTGLVFLCIACQAKIGKILLEADLIRYLYGYEISLSEWKYFLENFSREND